jgi:hypothetical protein
MLPFAYGSAEVTRSLRGMPGIEVSGLKARPQV